MEISTSILTVKEENAIQTFYNLESAQTDYFHIDVMDGNFVENDTSEIMKKYTDCLKNISNTPLDVHLMVSDVKKYVDIFAPNNPSIISFHTEAVDNVMDIINYIKNENCKVGLAISPETDIEKIYEYLPYIHLVLIMSVKPGKGGQKFIEETIHKIEKIKKYINENNLDTEIEVDGGVTDENIKKLKDVGVDIAVVGSFIINSKDYKYTISNLKKS